MCARIPPREWTYIRWLSGSRNFRHMYWSANGGVKTYYVLFHDRAWCRACARYGRTSDRRQSGSGRSTFNDAVCFFGRTSHGGSWSTFYRSYIRRRTANGRWWYWWNSSPFLYATRLASVNAFISPRRTIRRYVSRWLGAAPLPSKSRTGRAAYAATRSFRFSETYSSTSGSYRGMSGFLSITKRHTYLTIGQCIRRSYGGS